MYTDDVRLILVYVLLYSVAFMVDCNVCRTCILRVCRAEYASTENATSAIELPAANAVSVCVYSIHPRIHIMYLRKDSHKQ